MVSRGAGLLFFAIAVLASAGCEARVSLGQPCVAGTDCTSGLVCGVGDRCRDECATSAECGEGRCLRDPDTGRLGCSLVTDGCTAGSCADGLRCVDGQCLGVCVAALDCPDGLCVGTVCVVPPTGADAGVVDGAISDSGPALGCPAGGTLDVDVGYRAVCAVRCDHRIFCWGMQSVARSAEPESCDGTECSTRPVERVLPAGADVVEVAVGDELACARRADGEVWCWGWIAMRYRDDPLRIEVDGGGPLLASEITAGRSHICARERSDPSAVRCFGVNAAGQLGDGQTTDSATATSSFSDVAQLVVGEWRTHVVRRDGTVAGAGDNSDAQIAWPSSELVAVPSPGPSLPGPVQGFGAAVDQNCALLEAGDLACWGRESVLLGRTTPPMSELCGCPNVSVCGSYNQCTFTPLLLPRGDLPVGPLAGIVGDPFGSRVIVWDDAGITYGVGGSDALLLGPEPYNYEPVRTTALAGRATHDVSVGFDTACAILDGTRELVCWGANLVGQLGRGFASDVADTRGRTAEPPLW